ncbi:signal recognition particle-docking protein FtsY [Colwellia sp. E2M01]|uniref:signal recognition particle-docking protein FtsY n=1 Tax=Colwellia sp. E2M01 TaxID=2841561 RepID=UPI001C084F16|nr:signal recognition particle-docking protein FtsY [Colwellia sp. E2M01]MBU2869565.1 signal recognition particle-docking protein FtsY [Colwellia sp. E2M01]
MLSWLGFGQKEKQSSTEENDKESVVVAEQAPVTEIEPADKTVDIVTEQEVEPVEQDNTTVTADVNDTAKAVEAVEDAEHFEKDAEKTVEEIVEEENNITESVALNENVNAIDEPAVIAEAEEVEEKLGFFARLKQGLSKTRQNLGGGLADLFRGKQIDDDLFEELETHLLMADVGVETTMKIIDSLTQSASRKQLKDASALYDLLKIELKKVIEEVSQPLVIPEGDGPFVMLMVGVNGVGKTTTIGKLAKQFQAQGKSVMLAAGDTFRAAAVEQLQVWGERNDIPVIAQHTGADSASVIFDAISAAKARKVDVIIADTAGRLQNKAHLMEELKKVVRVMKKLDVNAPHEVMLTLDAGTGQNALSQTKLFDDAVGLTGLTITKLDGTAKGGVVFAIADKHNIPIRYLGVGEGIDDLRPFNGEEFIDAIFSN